MHNAINKLSEARDSAEPFRWTSGVINVDAVHRRPLHSHADLFARLQRTSVTGCFCWNLAENSVMWSEEASRILSLDNNSHISLDQIISRVHAEDVPSALRMLDEAYRGIELNFECRLSLPDKSIRYVRIVTATTERGQDLEYVGTIQDVTPQRSIEGSLDRMRSELAHLAGIAGLGALTASIVHEVSQPLTGILANTSACLRVLASEAPDLDTAREILRLAMRDGQRASEIITGLRALFTKKAMAIQPMNLNAAIRDVMTLVGSELRRRGIELQLIFDDSLPSVLGDKVQLQQVILNLLLNAVEAMNSVPQQGRQLWLATARDDDKRVQLTVRDTGAGIEVDDTERMFDAFYTTKRQGMGIGLTISRSIVESHGGRLWAEPNAGAGATFYLFLPIAPSMHAIAEEPVALRKPASL